MLNVSTGERHKRVTLEEVKDTLAQEVSDDADVVAEVKRVSQVDTLVAVVLVIACQCRQDPQLDAASIAVFLHRADDFDGDVGVSPSVVRLHHLAKGALAEELYDRVCRERVSTVRERSSIEASSTYIARSSRRGREQYNVHHHRQPFGHAWPFSTLVSVVAPAIRQWVNVRLAPAVQRHPWP